MSFIRYKVGHFSWYITGTALVLMLIMSGLSYWQWTRHLEKLDLIKAMDQRLLLPPVPIQNYSKEINSDPPINSEISNEMPAWKSLVHRRLIIEGDYDYEHEMVLRNRRYANQPGVMILTPLKIKDTDQWILVNRGYVPLNLADRQNRLQFQKNSGTVSFVALIKEDNPRKFLAPQDPPAGSNFPWVDAWLRVDLGNINKQLPFRLLPIYCEVMPSDDIAKIKHDILSSESSKNEMLSLVARSATSSSNLNQQHFDLSKLPIPVNDLIIPPGRHLGYVFEWLILAFLTGFIAFILQLRRQ
jgi:cytochrome oxidase assembly protein ShyY1